MRNMFMLGWISGKFHLIAMAFIVLQKKKGIQQNRKQAENEIIWS